MKNMDGYACLAVAQSWREFRFLSGSTVEQWWALPATPWALATDDSQPEKNRNQNLWESNDCFRHCSIFWYVLFSFFSPLKFLVNESPS